MFEKLKPLPSGSPSLTIDGVATTFEPGDVVAAVLLRQEFPEAGVGHDGRPRAPFCMMGVCIECLAHIDGSGPVRTCLCLARPGQRVECAGRRS